MAADHQDALRVALLTTYYHPVIGGVESHARQIAGDLRDRGVHVTVVTKRLDRATPATSPVDGVPVVRVPPAGGRSRFAKWTFLPGAFVALLRLRPRPDLIFCPDFRAAGIAALAAGRIIGRPVVLQAETPGAMSCASWDPDLARLGIRPTGRLARAIKWPFRVIYASASQYTCISRENEADALSCGVPAERLAYVPHAVDIWRYHPPDPHERASARRAAGVEDDRLLCLFVGRLSVEKGVLDLLEAWRQVAPRHATLLLVGPDMPGHPLDAGAAAREFVRRHGLSASVVFAGPTADASGVMRAADLFVQPSHYEAFGVSAIEAMASGLPVLATAVGGMLDYMVDGENALLCEPHDPASIANRLERLLRDEALRRHLSTRARATTEQLFDTTVVADTYLRIFRSVASPRES